MSGKHYAWEGFKAGYGYAVWMERGGRGDDPEKFIRANMESAATAFELYLEAKRLSEDDGA